MTIRFLRSWGTFKAGDTHEASKTTVHYLCDVYHVAERVEVVEKAVEAPARDKMMRKARKSKSL